MKKKVDNRKGIMILADEFARWGLDCIGKIEHGVKTYGVNDGVVWDNGTALCAAGYAVDGKPDKCNPARNAEKLYAKAIAIGIRYNYNRANGGAPYAPPCNLTSRIVLAACRRARLKLAGQPWRRR